MFHRLKSGRTSLAEEKRILKEIKYLEDQKESFCADVEAKKWIPPYYIDTLNSKESIQNQLKVHEAISNFCFYLGNLHVYNEANVG